MVKKKYELANNCKKEIEVLRDIISNPNKIFNKETIFQKVGESVLKNLWGTKAQYYSSGLPEHSDMLKGTPLEGIELVPLTSDVILRDKHDPYRIPRNREDQLIKDEDEIRRIEEMKREYFEIGMGKIKKEPFPIHDADQPIPTLMNNEEMKRELENLYDSDDPKRYNLELLDLDEETMAMAQPMIGVFGLDIMKKLFAADWHLREEALKDIEREIQLGSKSALCGNLTQEEIFSAGM